MKKKMKKMLGSMVARFTRLTGKTKIGLHFQEVIINTCMENTVEVMHNSTKLKFATPNSLCFWRANTFSTKEPETLEWIDRIPENSIIWDIGANVGLYSVYAAKAKRAKVWAFEPSVFNLELLARNIFLNNLQDKICIVPFALSDELSANKLRMSTTQWGGALSTFGKSFGWDGKPIDQVFEFQTIGMSMQDIVTNLQIPQPQYIKMDVDGLEHFILKGGMQVLQNVKEILIEINDDFHEQSVQCSELLEKAGLVLKEKKHSDIIANSDSGFSNSYNQIWVSSK